MKKVLLSLSATAVTVVTADPHWKLFQEFKAKYDVEFESQDEDSRRFRIFKDNMEEARTMNQKSKGNTRFGPTKFSHLTNEEFKKTYLGYRPKVPKNKKTIFRPKINSASSVDWRGSGAITPVKDQGQCGSCWAFSATQAVESALFMHSGEQKILAPQQPTSCDKVDYGCNGGNTETAFEYFREAGGVELEADYPYVSGVTEMTGRCKAKAAKFEVAVGETKAVAQGPFDEDNMISTIQSTPISICVDASPWQLYMGGVIDASTCGTSLDHCVHLVGYKAPQSFDDSDDSGGNYWIVKNSWAANWGEEGYIRVRAGENACGVAEDANIVEASDENIRKDPVPVYEEAVQILEGVAKGMGIMMAAKCINAGENLVTKFADAYTLMQKKTALDMARAMRLVATALEADMPSAAKNCGASADELKALIKSLSIMQHPKDFIYHIGKDLQINGVDIYRDINDSVGFYKKKRYENMGESIGTALKLLLVGAQTDEIMV